MLTLCCNFLFTSAQFVYKVKADSVKITNDSCNAELILENSTPSVKGFLYNKGNGRTEFRKPVFKLTDSTYLFGADTLTMSAFINNGNAFNGLATIGTKDNNDFRFITNGQERGRIISTGEFLWNTPTCSDNFYKIHLNGNIRTYGLENRFGDSPDNLTSNTWFGFCNFNVVKITTSPFGSWEARLNLKASGTEVAYEMQYGNGDPGSGIKIQWGAFTLYAVNRPLQFNVNNVAIAEVGPDGLSINKLAYLSSGEKLQVNGQVRIDTLNNATGSYSYVVWDSATHRLQKVYTGISKFSISTAGDAGFTAGNEQVTSLPVISANRTVTLTGSEGQAMKIYVKNNSVNTWSVSPAIQLKNGTTITSLTNSYTYDMIYIDGGWKVLNW